MKDYRRQRPKSLAYMKLKGAHRNPDEYEALPSCPHCLGGGRVSRGVVEGVYHCSQCNTDFE